jgi:hypothetical protein
MDSAMDSGEEHPQQPESRGELWFRLLFLVDAQLVYRELAFGGQESGSQSSPRQEDCSVECQEIPKQLKNDAHGFQNMGAMSTASRDV